MKKNPDFITSDLAKRIYLDLKKGENGEIPYRDITVGYHLKSRKDNNLPEQVKLDIIDEEGYRVDIYQLKYGSSFADFTVEQDNSLE